MVGNASVPAVALTALALHATLRTPYNVAALDASAAVDNYDRNGSARRRRRLRRPAGAAEPPEEPIQKEFDERTLRRLHFIETMEATAEAAAIDLATATDPAADEGRRRLQGCQWYPDPQRQDGCTSDPDQILPAWKSNPLMLHDTADACCELFYRGRECRRYPSGGCSGDDAGGNAGGNSAGDAAEDPVAPRGCVSMGWHADMDHQDGCTDDDNYPEDWLRDQIRDHMFHPTVEACCYAVFPGRPCKTYESGCAPAAAPKEECTSPGWHPHRGDGCSNGVEYEAEWLQVPTRETMFFPTHAECCAYFQNFGGTCQQYDEGCTIDPQYNFCLSEWHPDSVSRTGCANDGNVPPLWEREDQRANYFFGTVEECCAKYHKGGRCAVRDACNGDATSELKVTERPTGSPTWSPNECKWHPLLDGGDPTCRLSGDYPRNWRTEAGRLFDSHEECCREAHGVEECGREVVCVTDTPTVAPTTAKPSKSPVVPPTSSPTRVYYQVWNSHDCVAESDYPRPHYVVDSMTFADYEACCNSQLGENRQNCLANGPTPPPTEFAPTVSPGPTTIAPSVATVYYVEHFGGICLAVTEFNPLPHYATGYDDYWECCENSHKREECLAQGPTRDPTGRPTVVTIGFPSGAPSKLSAPPSSQPSGPTPSPTTLYWGAYMAFTSKPTQRPTKVDCSGSFWHVDSEAEGFVCSNIDAELESKDATLLFVSAEACCAHYFGGLQCTLRDNCLLSDWVIPAESNWASPEEECDNRWHPDIGPGRSGCSNSLNVPDNWETSKVTLLFDSVDDCCEDLYTSKGHHCKVYNYCVTEPPTNRPTTPRPTPSPVTPPPVAPQTLEARPVCDAAKWHIASGSQQLACSNSLTYPNEWNDPLTRDKWLFDSFGACCARYSAGNQQACGRLDECVEPAADTTGACETARWHMSEDFSKCTNSHEFPDDWLAEESRYFFDTPLQCCVSIFGYAYCDTEDICEDAVATPEPTRDPTLHPTTNKPTTPRPTTRNPTPLPSTQKPTPLSIVSDGANPCSGKNRRQCSQDVRCTYNRPGRICLVDSRPEPNPPPKKPTSSVVSPSAVCEGKRTKKQCNRTSAPCIWNEALNSCAGPDIAPVSADDAHVTDPSNCDARKWHPKTIDDRTCSNSLHYPPLWDRPDAGRQYLFNTYRQCCQSFYGGRCAKDDVCEAGASS